MIGRLVECVRHPAVVCAWCGAEMRRARALGDSERESRGMCQTCFRHMVEEHTRAAASPPTPAHASDR